MERHLTMWHKKICIVTFRLAFYLVKKRMSKDGLAECAALLEQVAHDIRKKMDKRGNRLSPP